MTHLTWRNGRAYFRYPLPPELKAIPTPMHWPDELQALVSNSKPSQLKHELSKALGTRDEKVAKRAAAASFVWADEIVQRGLAFLKEGPKATLSHADIELMANRYGATLIAGDMDFRKAGLGLDLSWPNRLTIGPTLPPPKREPGLSDDDLGLLKFVVDIAPPLACFDLGSFC